MAEVEKDIDTTSTTTTPPAKEPTKMKALEAKAVDKAKATADAAFKPSTTALNSKNADALLAIVDGPVQLDIYDAKESVYVGRSIPLAAGKTITVPIQVSVPGSVVDYSIEVPNHDVGLAIDAERDEGVTIVKDLTRVNAADSPLKQKFLVGTIPCLIKFTFRNDYSWMREKLISYKITVSPPTKTSLAQSRRSRAATSLKIVQQDLLNKQLPARLEALQKTKTEMEASIAKLQTELAEKEKALKVATKEQAWLQERTALRTEQERLLKERLKSGWKDEKDVDVNGNGGESSSSNKKK